MLRLSRLPRARPRATLDVRPSPGHANPHFLDRARLIDPAHPAAQLGHRRLPAFTCPHFTIRAFPNAILHEPIDFVPLNPLLATALVRARTHVHQRHRWWSDLDTSRTEPRPTSTTSRDKRGSVNATRQHLAFTAAKHLTDARAAAFTARGWRSISLLFHIPKKATSKSSVIRRRLRSKMTAAIRLIVGRNVDAITTPETGHPRKPTSYPSLHLVCRPLQGGETLVLQGWTYLIIPNLSIYKIPFPNLIQAVRKALLSIIQRANHLEASWSVTQGRQPPASQINLPLRRSPKLVDKPHSRTHYVRRLNPLRASDRTQGSVTSRGPSISTHLYSHRPVILSHGKLGVEK